MRSWFTLVGVALSACGSYDAAQPVYDVAIGASPGRVVTMTNGAVHLHAPPALDTVTNGWPLTCTAVGVGDPDVQYDAQSDRWYFAAFDGGGGVALAVSAGATPLSPYACYRLSWDTFGGTTDQPRISVTSNKVTITTQAGLAPSATLVINKIDVVLAQPTLRTSLVVHDIVYRPARNQTGEGPLYLVGSADTYKLRVRVITGVPGGGGVETTNTWVGVPFDTNAPLPDMHDPAGVVFRELLNNRTMHSVVVYGVLYTLTQTSSGGIGQLGWAMIAGLDPFAPYTLQHAVINPPVPGGTGVSCPALAVTPNHDVVIGFSAAGPSNWLSIYVTGRHLNDPGFTLRAPVLAAGGHPWNPESVPTTGFIRSDYCDGTIAGNPNNVLLALNVVEDDGRLHTRVLPITPGMVP